MRRTPGWSNDEIEAAAAAAFWVRNEDRLREIGLANQKHLENVFSNRELHGYYVWSPGDGTPNDPPVYVEEIYLHAGSGMKSDLQRVFALAETFEILLANREADGVVSLLTDDQLAKCATLKKRRVIEEEFLEDNKVAGGYSDEYFSAVIAAELYRSGVW